MDTYATQTPGLTAGSADLTDNTGMELKGLTIHNRETPAGASSTTASASSP
jgi:hypothetical protein